jgi:hypothetical protein
MPREKVKARLSKVLILLAALLVVPVGGLLLVAYEENARKNAWEEAESLRLGFDVRPAPSVAPPKPSMDTTALGPKDDFYRYLQAGTEPGGDGGRLHHVVQSFVKKDDVLAHSKARIWKAPLLSRVLFGWESFRNILWREDMDWCIRLRMRSNDKAPFAYQLRELSLMDGSDSLGLAGISDPSDITLDKFYVFIERTHTKELLIPVTTSWEGTSSKNILQRSWKLSPESGICKLAPKR